MSYNGWVTVSGDNSINTWNYVISIAVKNLPRYRSRANRNEDQKYTEN